MLLLNMCTSFRKDLSIYQIFIFILLILRACWPSSQIYIKNVGFIYIFSLFITGCIHMSTDGVVKSLLSHLAFSLSLGMVSVQVHLFWKERVGKGPCRSKPHKVSIVCSDPSCQATSLLHLELFLSHSKSVLFEK